MNTTDPNGCSAIGETACYSSPGCGYCVSQDYDGDCVPGDMTGPFNFSDASGHDCNRQYTAGVYRTPDSMCVITLNEDDVRCYKDCTYGLPGQGETFVVPNASACNDYDSAYKAAKTDPELRKEVHMHVSTYILTQAVFNSHIDLLHRAGYHDHATRANTTWRRTRSLDASLVVPTAEETSVLGLGRVLDLTRDLLHSKIEELEQEGLGKLEDYACEGVCPECAPFCHMVFTSDFAAYLNKMVVNIPIVQNINNWLADSVADAIPDGARNAMDDVIDVYNDVKKAIEPAAKLVSTCASVASKVASTLFGWL